MTRDEAMMVFRDAISAGQALAPFAGEEAAATVIQQAFAERDGEIDSAYYNGAKQAMAMAEQSMPAAREWLLGGCGGRAAAHAKALAAKGDSRG